MIVGGFTLNIATALLGVWVRNIHLSRLEQQQNLEFTSSLEYSYEQRRRLVMEQVRPMQKALQVKLYCIVSIVVA